MSPTDRYFEGLAETIPAGVPKGADRRRRDLLVHAFAEIATRVESLGRDPQPDTSIVEQLTMFAPYVVREYFQSIPRMILSRCPYCLEPLARAFDPWGFDGFWWQWKLFQPTQEPPACRHFVLLQGAVNLNDTIPMGGLSEALIGPEVPFVVPRLLAVADVRAVISRVELDHKYRAFPIAYFSEQPLPARMLMESWTQRTFGFLLSNGCPVWSFSTSVWDFELLPWVQSGKVSWIAPGDENWGLHANAENFPFENLRGRRKRLVVQRTEVREEPLPDGTPYDPFPS